MKSENTVHLIGNAHLDPVFLWTLPDGLSEIKATFRSALDRIKQFDEFVFTSACISYYAWVEENEPEMFKEIKEAVENGRWCIVGGMWVQPDCNIPCEESFARHLLYSQKFTRERFGLTVKTGYNVDSFGHTGSLPKLLNEGGIENYVFMRPSNGEEKAYPFSDSLFRWKYGQNEVTAFRIMGGYGYSFHDDSLLKSFDEKADAFSHDIMLFYGVGNHGGGPTVKSVLQILEYQKHSNNSFIFSSPEAFFEKIKKDGDLKKLAVYSGDLQNHASGCYSANSAVKTANASAEKRLIEAEKWLTAANALLQKKNDASFTEEAWKGVLFNQFHDLLCGCSVKSSFEDAINDFGFAKSVAFKLKSQSLQAISWAIDTSKGVKALSKESDWLWESDNLGTPVVVFNPLSYDVTVPVKIRKPRYCSAVTYECDGKEIPLPFQEVRNDATEHDYKNCYLINAPVPAFGYRTFWVYAEKEFVREVNNTLKIGEYFLENSAVRVEFSKSTGDISSFYDKREARECVSRYAGRPILIDDSENDTWAHGNFVFDKTEGSFSSPEFKILESGECQVSILVKRFFNNNSIEQIFSLYKDDPTLYVGVRLFMYDELKAVKLCFTPSGEIKTYLLGTAGGVVEKEANGREQPTQRFVSAVGEESGLAVSLFDKYSVSANSEYFSFTAVRTCYFADHMGERDGRLLPQDLGLTEFKYALSPYYGDVAALERTSEILASEFPLINETYHTGPLKQSASLLKVSEENVSLTAIKAAEDGNGVILRLRETAGRETDAVLTFLDKKYNIHLFKNDIASFRISGEMIKRTDFLED